VSTAAAATDEFNSEKETWSDWSKPFRPQVSNQSEHSAEFCAFF